MSGGSPYVERLRLPALPVSVGEARRAVRRWLSGAGREDLCERAELAVSEVVTNALVHAGTEVELTFRLAGGAVRVEVGDGNPHLPRTRAIATTSGTGRGLTLLDATVDRWGADLREAGTGKVVWFELGDVAASDVPIIDEPRDGPAAGSDAVVVELLDVPLLLIAAWFEHAGALLREQLLVRLEDDDDAGRVLERHAAASEVLSLLAEQWPELPELSSTGPLAGAVEPQVTAPRLTLRVPRRSVAAFAVLDEVLDDALELADSGVLLTPPTQPEMREMRRWLTREVDHQARGAGPRPQPFRSDLASPVRPAVDWDSAAVDEAASAYVAADDTNRIVAASPAALELLGHPRHELVGNRLLAIIPPRFHQAHLAGFALHLVNGRGPLLDTPVRVPVLRADGTELRVELTISAETLPHGRSVFVAELRPDPS